ERRRQEGDGATERDVVGRKRPRDYPEVGYEPLELRAVGVERGDRGVEVANEVRQVVRLRPEERLVDERRVLERARRGPICLVQPGGAAVLDERVPERVQQGLEVLADVR